MKIVRQLAVCGTALSLLISAGSVHQLIIPAGQSVAAPAHGTRVLPGHTPEIVRNGQARLLGAARSDMPMTIDISLPFRNQAELTAFIADQASRGIYLTQSQFDAEFAPTTAQIQAVKDWGAGYGLTTTYTSADGVTISMHGAASSVQRALGVQLKTYSSAKYGTFFSAASDPTVPAQLGIRSIVGLDSIPRFHTLSHAQIQNQIQAIRANTAVTKLGYYPSDFRRVYDVGHGYDGTGQVIGFTLWGAPVSDTDLAYFASATGDPQMTGSVFNPSGVAPDQNAQPTSTSPNQIDWVYTNGADTTTDAQVETAMDIEYAHGMAPNSHLVYYLGDQIGTCPNCGGDDAGLVTAISLAANNPLIHVVSNSWGGSDVTDPSTDPLAASADLSFQHAVAVGTTFYFSSGDYGSESGFANGTASYPADSPYVVSVGGTTLHLNTSSGYGSETVWHCTGSNCATSEGAGAGCASYYAQPSWAAVSGVLAHQTNLQTLANGYCMSGGFTHRVEPDVSADADPDTGADVYFYYNYWGEDVHAQIGGTSLAAPLWAGMAAVANRYAAANGFAGTGWAAPQLYTLGNTSAKYATDFHDVTQGTINGTIPFPASVGWDEATGWGSIDWWNWVQDMVGKAPLSVRAGWNLITLPVVPAVPIDAKSFLTALVAATGGGYAEIDAYTNGHFSPSLFDDRTDGLGIGGTNFTLQVGRGYALYSDRAANVTITGSVAATQPLSLSRGWNLIGFPDAAISPKSAYTILGSLLNQTHGNYAEIDGYTNGIWNPTAYVDHGTQGSSDFTVQRGQGYAVYTDVGTS